MFLFITVSPQTVSGKKSTKQAILSALRMSLLFNLAVACEDIEMELCSAEENTSLSVCLLWVLERDCCMCLRCAIVAASIFRRLSSYAFSGLVVK